MSYIQYIPNYTSCTESLYLANDSMPLDCFHILKLTSHLYRGQLVSEVKCKSEFKPTKKHAIWGPNGGVPVSSARPLEKIENGLTLIPAWISNHMPSKMGVKLLIRSHFNGYTVEVWEWKSNLISRFIMNVITYPWWYWIWTMLVKWATCHTGSTLYCTEGEMLHWFCLRPSPWINCEMQQF